MNKHTSGPWESSGCTVWQKGGDMICDLSMAMRPPNETEANSYLIAAAPRMLEVLEIIESDDSPMPTWLWQKIKMTIARAKGEKLEDFEILSERISSLIGPLLDAWDDLPNDLKHDKELEKVKKIVSRINQTIELE